MHGSSCHGSLRSVTDKELQRLRRATHVSTPTAADVPLNSPDGLGYRPLAIGADIFDRWSAAGGPSTSTAGVPGSSAANSSSSSSGKASTAQKTAALASGVASGSSSIHKRAPSGTLPPADYVSLHATPNAVHQHVHELAPERCCHAASQPTQKPVLCMEQLDVQHL